jgi:hypothetical protein
MSSNVDGMRLRPLATLTIAAAAATLLLPAIAGADFQTLYDDYRADGAIDGCAYSSSDLSAGLSEIPADVRQYDPGFSAAINAALDQVAAGCNVAPEAPAKDEVTAADGSPGPAVPHPLAFHAAGTGRGLPGVLVALIAVLGAALAAGAFLGAAHYYGWDLRRRVAPVSGAARGAERRLADGLRSLLDRLGP